MAKGFTKNGSPQRAESKVQPWFGRRFDFNFPIARFPNICVRLRGTPARLEEILKDAATDLFTAKPDGKWSAQEHAGHLFDLEPLWMARVEDFLTDGDTLTVADLTNRKTDEANHNSRTLREIAMQGADAFYKGEVAKRMVADLHAHGNAMKLSDMARYFAAERDAVQRSGAARCEHSRARAGPHPGRPA